jgi:hypothetical protein
VLTLSRDSSEARWPAPGGLALLPKGQKATLSSGHPIPFSLLHAWYPWQTLETLLRTFVLPASISRLQTVDCQIPTATVQSLKPKARKGLSPLGYGRFRSRSRWFDGPPLSVLPLADVRMFLCLLRMPSSPSTYQAVWFFSAGLGGAAICKDLWRGPFSRN